MTIRILPPHVAALIAAGEVIDRPSSVVKELVENALDAGATRIEIAARGDRLDRIAVTDDGKGMRPEDLALAFGRHATSKLPGDDVSRIATLGYRGEALPSIAAVADVRAVSRPKGQDVAFSVNVRAGEASRPRPSSGQEGTRIDVEGIFERHPGRRKFMKAASTEAARVRETVALTALCRPETAFHLDVNGRTWSWPARSTFAERAADLLGDPARGAVEVNHAAGTVEVTGLAGMPSSRRTGETRFAVNGRPVTDRVLSEAVKAAYAATVGPGASPWACLSVRLPPEETDVNVHPRKAEIRFRDPSAVSSAVTHAVSAALSSTGLRPPGELAALALSLAVPGEDDPVRRPLGRYLGQAGSSWIVSETADGIAIVDQHAAHERVVMERLRRAASGAAGERVRLPSPVTVRVTEEEDAAELAAAAGTLAEAGFEVRAGNGSASLVAYPAILSGCDPEETCMLAVRAAAAGTEGSLPATATWEILASAACRAAIKAGDGLTRERGDALLREIESTPGAGWCNHGRPTVVYLKDADLGRLFGR